VNLTWQATWDRGFLKSARTRQRRVWNICTTPRLDKFPEDVNILPGVIGGRRRSPIAIRPFHGEGVGQVAYFLDRTAGQEHLHDVEADFYGRPVEQVQVVKPRAGQPAAALRIDGRGRAPPFLGGTRFDLDEDQAVALAEDEVDLAALGAEVGGEEFEAAAFEMPFGGAFAEFAKAQMRRFGGAVPPGFDASQKLHLGKDL